MVSRRPAPPGTTPVQADNKRRLEDLLKRPDNQVCADCPERGPRWASATMGTFICIKCSGIHRNLGVHISFVRSVNLDEWKTEHVEQMERWGNGRARAYFEAEVPSSYARPSDWSNVQQMTKWIRDKYEYKRFLPRDGSVPERQPVASSHAPGTNNEPSSSRERKPRDRPSPTPSSLPPSSSSFSTPALIKAKAAPAPIVDLLDFTAPDPTPPPPSLPASLPSSSFNFDAPVAAAAGPPPSLPPSLPVVEMTSNGKPKLTTDQLLSMFMTPAAPPPPPPQQQQQQQQQPGMYGGQAFAQPGYPYQHHEQQQPQHHQQQHHHHQQHHHPQQHQQQQQHQNPFGPPPSGGGGMMGGMGGGMAPPQQHQQQHQQQQAYQGGFGGMTSMMPRPSFPPAYPPQQQQQQQQQSVWPPQPQQGGGMNGFPF